MRAAARTTLSAASALALLLSPVAARVAQAARATATNAIVSSATDTLDLTLDGAIQLALEHGTDMRAARLGVEYAHGRVWEAAADALPQLDGALNYTRTFASVFSGAAASGDSIFGPLLANTPFAAENAWSFDITASQMLYSRKIGAALSAARLYRKGNEALRDQTAADVRLAVTRAYLDAAAAAELTSIAQSGLEQARGHLTQVELFRRQGTRAEYDLIQAQVDARNAEPPVVATRNDYQLAMLELARQIGAPYTRALRLESPVRFVDGMVPVAEPAAVVAGQRAALVAAQTEVDGRKKLLDMERAARWPELKVSGTLSQEAFPSEDRFPMRDQFRRNIQASARLQFPLFLGLKSVGAIARATAELEQSEVRRDAIRQSLDLELARARQDVDRTLALLLARRGTVALAQRAHTLAGARYDNGMSTQLEVSDARLQLLTAEGNEVIAARDYRVALAALEHALGRPVPVTQRSLEQLTLMNDSHAAPDAAAVSR